MTLKYSDYRLMQDFETLADRLGFQVSNFRSQFDSICLTPKGSYKEMNATLPIFSRDAEFGVGTVEGNMAYLRGWERAIEYMKGMGLFTNKKLLEKEKYWNEYMKVQEEQREQAELLKVLKNG